MGTVVCDDLTVTGAEENGTQNRSPLKLLKVSKPFDNHSITIATAQNHQNEPRDLSKISIGIL